MNSDTTETILRWFQGICPGDLCMFVHPTRWNIRTRLSECLNQCRHQQFSSYSSIQRVFSCKSSRCHILLYIQGKSLDIMTISMMYIIVNHTVDGQTIKPYRHLPSKTQHPNFQDWTNAIWFPLHSGFGFFCPQHPGGHPRGNIEIRGGATAIQQRFDKIILQACVTSKHQT